MWFMAYFFDFTPVDAHEIYISVRLYILSNASIVLLIATTKLHAKPIYLVRINVICHFWVNYSWSLSFEPKVWMVIQQRDPHDVETCWIWFIELAEKVRNSNTGNIEILLLLIMHLQAIEDANVKLWITHANLSIG